MASYLAGYWDGEHAKYRCSRYPEFASAKATLAEMISHSTDKDSFLVSLMVAGLSEEMVGFLLFRSSSDKLSIRLSDLNAVLVKEPFLDPEDVTHCDIVSDHTFCHDGCCLGAGSRLN